MHIPVFKRLLGWIIDDINESQKAMHVAQLKGLRQSMAGDSSDIATAAAAMIMQYSKSMLNIRWKLLVLTD